MNNNLLATAAAMSKDEAVQTISARIEKDVYKRIKVYSITHDLKFNDVIRAALKKFIENQERA